MKNIIPVVLATDENYAKPMSVTMTSIMENAKETTFIHFFILIPSIFSKQTIKKIDLIKSKYFNCHINYIDMKDSLQNVKMQIQHITCPTYYRLMTSNLLPMYDKCIYLDSDVIVNDDLTEFFSIDIENYYVAGVKAPIYHFKPNGNREYCDKVGLASIDQYINAGVLLMNLKKIRQDNILEKFITLSKLDFPSQDQDVINIACYGYIKHVPFKYNNMMSKYPKDIERLKKLFTEEEVLEANYNPVIIHFCDKIKPWISLDCKYADYWWKYAEKSPFGKEYLRELIDKKKSNRFKRKLLINLCVIKNRLINLEVSTSFKPIMILIYALSFFCCLIENGLLYTLKKIKTKILKK